MLTDQSEGGNLSVEVSSSRVTLVCVKLMKSNQPKDKIQLLCMLYLSYMHETQLYAWRKLAEDTEAMHLLCCLLGGR